MSEGKLPQIERGFTWSEEYRHQCEVRWLLRKRGMVGVVLTEARSHYLIAFGKVCQFVPKVECEIIKHETQEA